MEHEGTTQHTVAFTGQRPWSRRHPDKPSLYAYEDARSWNALRGKLAQILEAKAFEHGGLRVITGGAQGVDQTAFWAAEQAKARLEAAGTGIVVTNSLILPADGQVNTRWWSENDMFGKADYRRMVDAADDVRTSDEMRPDTAMSSLGVRLNVRNECMISQADEVIAVLNGRQIAMSNLPSHGSGTANAIRSTARAGLPLTLVDGITFQVTGYSPEQLRDAIGYRPYARRMPYAPSFPSVSESLPFDL